MKSFLICLMIVVDNYFRAGSSRYRQGQSTMGVQLWYYCFGTIWLCPCLYLYLFEMVNVFHFQFTTDRLCLKTYKNLEEINRLKLIVTPPKKRKTFLSPQSVEARRQHPNRPAFWWSQGAFYNNSHNAKNRNIPKKMLVEFTSKSKKFSNNVFPKIYRAATETFEESETNMLRILAIFYSNDVMGKKYIQICE